MLTLDEKKYAIEQWNLTTSYIMVRQTFRSIPGYHSKNLPSTAALRYIINKFEAHGTLLDRRSGKNASFLARKLTKLNTCIVISNASRLELQQENFDFQPERCLTSSKFVFSKRHLKQKFV